YIQISNYFGSNVACETWLISPSMNLNSEASPRLVFKSAYNYSGPALQVLVSTNYSSGDPNAATWTALSPALSGGSWNWVKSGNVSLSAYKSANTRIAFKYTGTNTSGSTWEIDDVAIFGQ
ncbi:MAG: choice-of-anchor J domain-containing protein, partial [Sphingobacteriaceae bacterium]